MHSTEHQITSPIRQRKGLDFRISLALLVISHKIGILSLYLSRSRSQIRKQCGELLSLVKAELYDFNT